MQHMQQCSKDITDWTPHLQLAFWQRELEGAPALRLPIESCPSLAQESGLSPSGVGGHVPLTVEAGLVEELECAARRAGVTLYMLLLTGLHLALRVLSGQDDFVVRAPAQLCCRHPATCGHPWVPNVSRISAMLLVEAVVASFIVTVFRAAIRLIARAGRVSALCVLHCSGSQVILHMCAALRPLLC